MRTTILDLLVLSYPSDIEFRYDQEGEDPGEADEAPAGGG